MKLSVLTAIVFLAFASGTQAGETFDDAMAAFQSANATGDVAHPGYATAFEIWSELADDEHRPSQYHLGVLHLYGLGGASFDQVEGARLIRESAQAGYPMAQAYMGVMSEKGEGLHARIGLAEARQWYEKAAEGGHCYSVRRLARAHEQGELGFEADDAQGQALRAGRPDCFEVAKPNG